MTNDVVHRKEEFNPHRMEHRCSDEKEDNRRFIDSKVVSAETLDKIRERMETALGHDNFGVDERDFKTLGRKKIVDADINIFFTDRTLRKRFIIYDGDIIGVKDRNT